MIVDINSFSSAAYAVLAQRLPKMTEVRHDLMLPLDLLQYDGNFRAVTRFSFRYDDPSVQSTNLSIRRVTKAIEACNVPNLLLIHNRAHVGSTRTTTGQLTPADCGYSNERLDRSIASSRRGYYLTPLETSGYLIHEK